MRKEKIMKRMQEHLDFYLKNYKNDWVYITLVGSQNYELDYSGSDIDTKIVILPNLEDIVLGRLQISTTLLMENEEHVDVKDIRQMFQTYRKQNINYLETLFTEFKIVNPKYEELIKPIFENRELIAHYDVNTAINCMCGMAMEKRKALCHPYPTIIDKIEKYGYDPKQLHHIARMRDFLERYINGEKFETCLIPTDKGYLLDLKTCPLNLSSALSIADMYMSEIKELKENFRENNYFEQNHSVEVLLTKVLKNVIIYNIEGEVLRNIAERREI